LLLPLPSFLRVSARVTLAGFAFSIAPLALPLPAQGDLSTWRERADRGDAEALNALGNAYALGQGVPRDDLEARRHYEAAAALDHAPAAFNLGLIHELGRGVPRNETEAARWYRQAANQKHPRAAYQLAVLLEDGRGVGRNETEAAQFYRVAAEQGIGAAQASLGLMMAAGRGGLPANLPEAHAWLTLSVENGGSAASRDLVAARMNDAQKAEAERILSGLRSRFSTLVPVVPVAGSETSAVNAPAVASAVIPVVAEGTPPVAFGQVGVSPAAEDTERADLRASVAQLTTENRELSTELRASEEQVRRLEQELATARQGTPVTPVAVTPPGPDPEKVALAADLAKAQASVTENLQVIAELTDEIDRLKAAGVPATEPAATPVSRLAPSADAEVVSLRGDVANMQARIDELSAALEARTRERDEALAESTTEEQNAMWTARLAEANQVSAGHQQAIADLTAINTNLTREVEALRAQVASLTGAVQILRGDNARLAAQAGVRAATGTAPIIRLPPPAPVAFPVAGRAAPSRPGTVITIAPPPLPAPAPVPASTAGPRTHTVASGETLSEISLRYYGSARRWAEIYEANLDAVRAPHLIRPGQRLRIP
jgi:nucleoid-associated protein YgaU